MVSTGADSRSPSRYYPVWRRCRCSPHSRPRRHPPDSFHRRTHRHARPGNSLKHHRSCRRLAIRRRKTQSLPRQVHPRESEPAFRSMFTMPYGSRRVTAAGSRGARVRHPSVRVVGRTAGRRRHGDHRTDSDVKVRASERVPPQSSVASHSSGPNVTFEVAAAARSSSWFGCPDGGRDAVHLGRPVADQDRPDVAVVLDGATPAPRAGKP